MNSQEAYEALQEVLKEINSEESREKASMAIEELYEKSCMYDDLTF